MPEPPTNKCPGCGGTGEIDGEFHMLCLGTGEIGSYALFNFLRDHQSDVMDKLDDIKEKVDEIKAIVDGL